MIILQKYFNCIQYNLKIIQKIYIILLFFQCNINISTFNKSEKKIVNELVKSIEDIDGFTWMYIFYKFIFKIWVDCQENWIPRIFN